jgi:serine phosphatase RsbU (regulator of sigma subunit)
MSRAGWASAWGLWSLAVVLAAWGAWEAPRRGETGILMRGGRVGAVLPGSPAHATGLIQPGDFLALRDGPTGHNPGAVRARLAHLRAGEHIAVRVVRPASSPPARTLDLAARPPSMEAVSWRLAWAGVALGLLALAWAVGRARRDALAMVFFLWCTVAALAIAPWPIWPWSWAAQALEAVAGWSALLLPVLLLHVFALFPEGRGRRRTRVAKVLYATAVVLALLSPAGALGAPWLSEVAAAAGSLFFAVAVALAVASFLISYRVASARHRRRLNVLLWCAVLGLSPVVGLTVFSNLADRPAPAPAPAAALLFLLVPAGFAYAIEVHQIFDFRWRRGPAPRAGIPAAPPVFVAGDARATVDAVAADLHDRLALSHCGVYWRNGGRSATLATWLGDAPAEGPPESLPEEVVQSLDRLARPADLDELRALAPGGSVEAHLARLERAGSRTLAPLYASHELRAVLALGSRLSDDLASTRRRAELCGYMEHASLAVEHAEFHDERVQRARVEREVELARAIQERLLPRRDPSFPTLACAGASVPSGRVCGDYFDYVELGRRRLGIVVADVCGKGVPAALLVSHLQAGLRLRAGAGAPPAEVVAGLNQDLARFHQPEKFVCLLYAVVDARSREVRWANGGLNPPLLFRRDGTVRELPSGDLILGVEPGTRYREWSERLAPGEGLVVPTDGVFDARRGGQSFGEARLPALVARWRGLRAPRLRDRILAEARAFHRDGPPDDMTALVVKAL